MTQALMDCDNDYIIAEVLARFTRQELMDALIQGEEDWVDDTDNASIIDYIVDIRSNGYKSKPWNDMTDRELADESIEVLHNQGKLEENE